MRLFVGIPAYDRKLTVETARSLLAEQGALSMLGHEMQVCFAPGSSIITYARDHLVKEFMASEADRLVFVDSDVGWELGMLAKLVSHSADFVGGCYRYKSEPENYPIQYTEAPELWADPETGLLEVKSLPGGFLSLSRDVFERLREAHPDRRYRFNGKDFYSWFHMPPGSGEDGTFCREWRELGGKVWLDPELTLTHVDGAIKYTGRIGDWLKSRAPEAVEAA